MTTYVVTGGTGFIGRFLVADLLNRGHRVIAPLRQSSANLVPEGAIFVDSDDLDKLKSAFDGAECIFHLATLFRGNHLPSEVRDMVDSNVRLTAMICEAALNAGVKKFIYTESATQHLFGLPFTATSLYASTKQAGTDILRYYSSVGLRSICLTLPDTLGPFDRRGKLISLLQKAAAQNERLLMSPGEQLVDYLYVSDVVSGLIHASNLFESIPDTEIEFFRLSSGHLISLKTFVEMVQICIKDPLEIEWGGRDYRLGEMFEEWTWPPVLPGWTPLVDLHTAIKHSLDAS